MTKKIYAKVALAIWLVIWILFLVRPYFKNNLLKEYGNLLKASSADEKRAYVTGRTLYEFIAFSKEAIGAPSTYRIIGLEERPLDERRAVYYLYPNIPIKDAQFLLVFGVKNFSAPNYVDFEILDSERYILKKIK